MTTQACVLLSGGLDSVAALCWAKRTYPDLFAIMFDYGQPNRDNELTTAGAIANELGVERVGLVIADSLPRGAGILSRVQDHDGRDDGTSPAFVPGRNIVFLACAAAHAAMRFPNGRIDLVIGANAHDAKRFPDCRVGTAIKMSEALRHGVGRDVTVVAPWVDRTRAQILASLEPADLDFVARSWSCYRGDGPCGKCGACVLRKTSLDTAGIVDRCAPAKMFGGDPARSAS